MEKTEKQQKALYNATKENCIAAIKETGENCFQEMTKEAENFLKSLPAQTVIDLYFILRYNSFATFREYMEKAGYTGFIWDIGLE